MNTPPEDKEVASDYAVDKEKIEKRIVRLQDIKQNLNEIHTQAETQQDLVKKQSEKNHNPATEITDLESVNKDLKDLVEVFKQLTLKAKKERNDVKQIKCNMHDCSIPLTSKVREQDIKQYVQKLREIEEEFAA